MPALEVWLEGGPADGRLIPVEVTGSGDLPDEARLRQDNLYVGVGDVPAAAREHRYRRVDDLDGLPVYRYRDPHR